MDSFLESTGAFGRYQKVMTVLIGTLSSLSSFCIFASVFIAAESDLLCKYTNKTAVDQRLINKTLTSEEKCSMWANITNNDNNNLNKETLNYECKYDNTYYGETIITEWNLICERNFLVSVSQTVHMVGSLCSVFCGWLGDRYGRRRYTLVTLLLLSITLAVSQLLLSPKLNMSIMTRYMIYTIAQFLIGALVNCCYCSSYVLLLELTDGKHKTTVSNINSYMYAIGQLNVAVGYYLTKNWHLLNWIIVIYSIVSFILLYFFLPESPQWLISMKKYDDAYKILYRIATVNKRKAKFLCEYSNGLSKFSQMLAKCEVENDSEKDSEDAFLKEPKLNENLRRVNVNDEDNSNNNNAIEASSNIDKPSSNQILAIFTEIFCPRKNFIKTILMTYVWNALTLLYYGVGLGITGINVINPYLMFFYSCIAEAVGVVICHVNDIFGRKKTFSGFLIISSIMCLLVALIPHDYELNSEKLSFKEILIVIFALISKAAISGAYNIIYIYTSELYNTSVRNTAVIFLLCVGSFGSFIAPQINLLRIIFWQPSPYIVYCACALLACIALIFLPETKDQISI